MVSFEPAAPLGPATPAARVRGRSDHEIALDFVADLRGEPATAAETALLALACEACRVDRDDLEDRGEREVAG